ncbi:MAG: sterol desaturase family protein [Bacteroidales bacterium]|nr:sterol desaturase family protein [Bacteroidales bacterium]MCF8402930.1 sterol desaturase family protein [Bacteroidales bacterium]
MVWIIAALSVIGAFFFMEFMAWFSHKYIMHGFLWVLHKDHHIRDGRKFEWNDLFAVIYAIPSIMLIYFGYADMDYRMWLGIGVFLYGMAYFMFHDVYVHQRVKMLSKISNRYLRATVKAHKEHHNPHAHYNYGFLVAPIKYYVEEFKKR